MCEIGKVRKSAPKHFSKILHRLRPGCGRLQPHYPPQPLKLNPVSQNPDYSYPRISIVVPSFNQGAYLESTLQSIFLQNYPDLELIVVDGGSDDNSVAIIKKYANLVKWWVSEKDTGQANAINKGMQHATGEVLAWLNSDDCLMPGALMRVAHWLIESPETDVVYGHRVLINEASEDIGKWILPVHQDFILAYADYIPQESLFWRSSLWEKAGAQLDESYRFAMDWDLIRRFQQAEARFQLLPAFLGQFRLHYLQKSQANIDTDGFVEMERIRGWYKNRFSTRVVLQNLYYRLQRANLYYFLLKARIKEIFWRWGWLKIE